MVFTIFNAFRTHINWHIVTFNYLTIHKVSINTRIIKSFTINVVTERAGKQYSNIALNKLLILILQKNNC